MTAVTLNYMPIWMIGTLVIVHLFSLPKIQGFVNFETMLSSLIVCSWLFPISVFFLLIFFSLLLNAIEIAI